MSEKLKYQIDFTVDTSSLHNSLKGAIEALNELGQNPRQHLTTSLKEASQAALELSTNLKNAYNQDTGKLDLSRFNQTLKNNGQTIDDYAKKIMEVGPVGEKAFLQVAQAIAKAELPVRRTNKLLDDMWLTLKNTVRWQVTSNALNAVVGQIQSAVSYTKNLDDSLNSIRIVTQKSSQEMDKFAIKANKAAQALSTTTTRYSDASLIYYQQGLSDEEVEGRVDTTIKLANVSGEDAKAASEQMTAIWNNFYDGSKSLEYYADAMAALGASTASSTQEISTGLQKFASVAGTVGLSYEYAASALATITATTRESADIVGTSLRTLFARIQGLNQDEEQEDGTTLNKYSKALAQVGIDIKDTTGKMKDMDIILNEMGERWTSLSKAQQLALAQTVAGVRQYAQLITLMDNWTFFQENLQTAYQSEGTLERQAEIFAESWEAAKARVRAASEDIYDSLINEQFFIDLDNMFTPFLGGVAKVVDSLGGMKGILGVLGVLVTEVYGDKISNQIKEFAINVDILKGKEGERARELQRQTITVIEQMKEIDLGNEAENNRLDLLKREIELQGLINEKWDSLNEFQQQTIKDEQYKLELLKQQNAELSKRSSSLYEKSQEQQQDLLGSAGQTTGKKNEQNWKKKLNQQIAEWNLSNNDQIKIDVRTNAEEVFYAIDNQLKLLIQRREPIRQLVEELNALQRKGSSAESFLRTRKELIEQTLGGEDLGDLDPNQAVEYIYGRSIDMNKMIAQYESLMSTLSGSSEKTREYVATLQSEARVNEDLASSNEMVSKSYQDFNKTLQEGISNGRGFSDLIVETAKNLSYLTIGIQSIQNLGRIINDEDISASEKIIGTITSLLSILPILQKMLQLVNIEQQIDVTIKGVSQTVTAKTISAKAAEIIAIKLSKKATDAETASVIANTAAKYANNLVLLAIVASAALVVAALVAISNAQQQETKDLENANRQLEELNNNYKECASSAERLKQTISDYENGVNALKNLKLQTDEYKETLEETNEKAKELIETYKLWNDYTVKNGKITFNENVLDELQKQEREKTRFAESQLNFGKIYANQSALQKQIANMIDSLNEGYIIYEGTSLGLMKNEEMYNLGKAVSEDGGIPVDEIEFRKLIRDIVPNIRLTDDVIEFLRNNLEKLSHSIEETTSANEYYAKSILKNAVEQENRDFLINTAGENEALYNTLVEVMTQKMSSVDGNKIQQISETQLTKDYNSNLKLSNILGQQISNDEELMRRYAIDYMGMSEYEVGLLSYANGIGKGNLLTSSGEKVFENDIPDEFQRKMLYMKHEQDQIIETLGETTENFNKEVYEEGLKNLITSISGFSQKFADETLINSILEALANEDFENINLDLSNFFANLSPREFDQLSGLNSKELLSMMGLDEESLNVVAGNSAQAWIEGFQKKLLEYDPSQFYQSFDNAQERATNLISSIQSGDTRYYNILEDENYIKLMEQLDRLQLKYPEIQASVIELSKNWNTGTQVYIEALEQVQDQLTQIKLEEKTKQADKLREKLFNVPVIANVEQFKQDMENLLNAEYSIDIEVHSSAEQEFNSIIGAMDDIQNKASMIGENFIISAEDIREFNNTFPGIVEGITLLGDGTAQVNQEVAQSAIEAARIEVQADTEAFIEKLTKQKSLLKQKQQMYQNMADAAKEFAQSDLDEEEKFTDAKAVLSAGLTDLMNTNSQIAATTEMDFAKEVADNSEINSEIIAQNGIGAYLSVAQASARSAGIQINNSNAVANNKINDIIDPNDLEVNYSGATGQSGEAKILQEAQSLLDKTQFDKAKEEFAKMSEMFQQMANSIGANINDIEGQIAEVQARSNSLNVIFDNIGSGLGAKGTKSGKLFDKEDLKDLKDIEDRYHEINREILRQSDLLDDISNDIDRAYGGEKLKDFSRQVQALQKQQENYQKKLNEAQERYLPQDIAKLAELFNNVTIKSNGEIANYENLLQQVIDEHNNFLILYNQFLTEYNAMTQAEQEANQTALEAWKERKEASEANYKSKLDALKQYEDTRDTIQEIRDAIEDNARAIADAKLSQVEYKLEIVLDVKQMKDALRDFDRQVNEIFNDALTHGLPVAKLDYDQAVAEANMYPEYKQQFEDLKALYEGTDEYVDRDRIIQDIKDLQGKILDSASAIVEWVNSIEDLIPNAVDAARERYNLFINQLEHNNTVLDTIKELYTLQGVTYKTMDGFNRLQKVSQEKLDSQLAQAELQKAWYDEARIRLQDAQAKLDSLNGDETDLRYDTYKKARDAYLKEFNEAEEAYLSLAKDAMETAQQMYEEQLEKALYDFGQIISKGIGLDLLQDKYDHYIEQNERYFDKVDEAYQTTAWFNKLQEDIDKATNSATKDRLKALQEEINIRRENNTLSQYDLNILNAKYEVLKAQMALEDAQNAKNKLKLVRDSQGNWNYQYVADENQIANAQQELIEKQNQWYQIAKEQVTQVTGEIVDTWKECQDKIKEIYSDMTLTDEERADRAAEIYKYYTDKIKYLENEKQIAISDMTEAGNAGLFSNAVIMGDKITDLTGLTSNDIKAIVEGSGVDIIGLLAADNETIKNIFIDNWSDIIGRLDEDSIILKSLIENSGKDIVDLINLDSETIRELIGNNTQLLDLFDNVYAKDLDNMTNTTNKFEDALRETLDKAETDFENFRDTVVDISDKTGTKLEDLDDKTNELSNSTDILRDSGIDAASALWEMINAVELASYRYVDMAQSIWGTVEALRALAAAQVNYVSSKLESGSGNNYISDGVKPSTNIGTTNKKPVIEEEKNPVTGNFGLEGAYNASLVVQNTIANVLSNIKKKKQYGGSSYGDLTPFDTGGYTGDFNGGRIALLHSKELVLNQKDTENILSAVNITRDMFAEIEKTLDGNGIAAMSLMAQRLSMPQVQSTSDTIEQNIHIDTIEFPNVTSSNEIQDAIISIANDAAQWARRRKE